MKPSPMRTSFWYSPLFFVFLGFLSTPSFGQSNPTTPNTATGNPIPTVRFEQGQIIGSLPYGRHFYIQGTTKWAKDFNIDRVKVNIYDIGRVNLFKKKKYRVNISEEAKDKIKDLSAQNLVATSRWDAVEAPKSSQLFNVYINAPLQFSHRYLIDIAFEKAFNFTLTKLEREAILDAVVKKAKLLYEEKNEIPIEDIQDELNAAVNKILVDKVAVSDGAFYDIENIEQDLKPVKKASLEKLGDLIAQIAIFKQEMADGSDAAKLKNLQQRRSQMADDDPDAPSLDRQIAKRKKSMEDDKADLAAFESNLSDHLEVIKSQLLKVSEARIEGSTDETSVTELQSIQIGSSFGGGFVGLNFNDDANRAYDAFSYLALKFYILPVDKRIADPYMDDVFLLNRLSFIFGVANNGNFDYNGTTLDKAFAVTPMIGMGYDFSRYFSIDVGMTVFKQQSVSPFSNDSQIRVAPVLGLNFDVDVFNRFSSLFTGDKYSLTPKG